MSTLQLNILGKFEARLPSGKNVSLPTRKAEVLLTYLALMPGKSHSRERLTNLLWSDRSEDQARNSLRQSLSAIKKALDGIKPSPLQIERTDVIVPEQAIKVDALELEDLIKEKTLQATARATRLYRGDFLEGLVIRDSTANEWLTAERDRFRRQAILALENLMVHQLETGDLDDAGETGERLVSLDSLNESAWRQLMKVYAARGERNQALMAYKRCAELLEKELGIKPTPETTDLQTEIRDGTNTSTSANAQSITSNSSKRISDDIVSEQKVSREKLSIAVLQFTNITGDPDQQYFADGMTSTIATELSRIQSLTVKSALTYEANGVSSAQIADIWNVAYLLRGSVQKQGVRVRVIAELIDGETSATRWSERYDRSGDGVLDIQDDIARAIVATLWGYHGRLQQVELENSVAKATRDFNAFDYVLRGIQYKERFTREDNIKAYEYFCKAHELNPEYADALAWMAWIHVMDVYLQFTENPQGSLEQAFELANKALELDRFSEIGTWVLGSAYTASGQSELGLATIDRALEINPNNPDILVEKGDALSWSGRAEEGVECILQSIELNPFHPEWYFWSLGAACYLAQRYAEAIEALDQMTNHNINTRLYQAASHARLGHQEEAKTHACQVIELDPAFSLGTTLFELQATDNPSIYKHLLEGLRLAGLPE